MCNTLFTVSKSFYYILGGLVGDRLNASVAFKMKFYFTSFKNFETEENGLFPLSIIHDVGLCYYNTG